MRFTVSVLLLLFLSNQLLFSQKEESKEVICVAEIQKIEATGKRHISYFFTFKITEVLQGKLKDSILTSQEIYHDFGGVQIQSKIYPDNEYFVQKSKSQPNKAILKLVYRETNIENENNCQLIWVAELYRRKSLERLENLLRTNHLSWTKPEYATLLLQEFHGKLFFGLNGKGKVAVEGRSGSWHIATIDDE